MVLGKRFLKDPISGLTHLVTAFAAVVGSFYLLRVSNWGSPRWCGIFIYCLTLIALFSASSAYHLIPANRKWERRLRKLDHAAIFLFIAGCYTPICMFALTGSFRVTVLIAVWSVAICGVAFKFFYMRAPRWLSVTMYLAMGWMVVVALKQLYEGLPLAGLLLLFLGGGFYTVGALIYATKKFDFFPNVFGHHEVWHLFVMAGSLAHYALISVFIAQAF